MVRGTEYEPGRITFRYEECYGMSQHKITVDTEWFNTQDIEHLDAKELEKLAREDKEHSNIKAVNSWWGLG